MKRFLLLLSFFTIFLFLLAITGYSGEKEQKEIKSSNLQLTVAAATSLHGVADELKTIYIKQHPEITITYNFASSGTLQKQIEEGAPFDLFISAGQKQMDTVAEEGLIIEISRKNLLGNELVLIAGRDSKLTGFESLTGVNVGKISIGTPDTVPAGKYAKETFTTLGIWEKLQPKLVLAKDVRQVLTYVETGNVDAGVLYRSDVMMGQGVKIISVAPSESHNPIVYPMAILKNSKQQKEAEDFAAFWGSEQAAKIFKKYGFKLLNK